LWDPVHPKALYLATACKRCLNKSYLEQVVRHEPERVLHEENTKPELRFEIGLDRQRRKHVALFGNRDLAYCGQFLQKPERLRAHVRLTEIPVGLCPECIPVLRGVLEQKVLLKQKEKST